MIERDTVARPTRTPSGPARLTGADGDSRAEVPVHE